MAETEEQPNLDQDGKDKVERPTAEPEHCRPAESDSSKNDDDNDERTQVSSSETTTSKASEPRPEPLLLDKQEAESSDQNEADRGEANTTTTENEDSGEKFEVIQLSTFGKEKPPKEMEEGMAVTTTTPQAGGSDTGGEGMQAETKEPDRGEKEACEEKSALQADREDQETAAAPTQTEETGADSGRATPKEEREGANVDAEKEGERGDDSGQQQVQKKGEEEPASQDASETGVTPAEAVGDEVSQEEEEEDESDEKMEVEASPGAAGRVDEGADSRGASSEQQQQLEEGGGGDGDAEDIPEMESTSKTDSPVQPLEMESKGEAESREAVALVSDDAAAQPMEDFQEEGEELSETKVETEYTKDENNNSTESEDDTRKNDTTPEVGIPLETNMETGNETATGPVSPFKDDVETGNVTVAQPPTVEESGSIEAATIEKEENSYLRSTSPSVKDKQTESEPAKDDEGNIDMAEDMPPPSSHDEREGEVGGEEIDYDNEQGLPVVQLGGATGRAPVEQAADKGSVQEQEECALKETLRAGDTRSMEAEPTVAKQDSEQHPKPVETTETDDNPEKIESDIKQPEGLTETTEVEQKGEDDAFKLELSFGSSEPDTMPSKDTSISAAADDEKSEIEKELEGAAVSKDAQEQAVEEDEEMDVSDGGVERETAVPDTQEETTTRLQEPRDAESAIITDQRSKETISLAENVLDTSEKSPTTADEESEVISTSPQQSEASEPKIAPSDDDLSDQPLSSTEAPPTSSAAPPTSPPLLFTEAPPTSSAAPPTSPPLSSTEAPPTSSAAPPTSPPLSSTEAPPTSSAAPPTSPPFSISSTEAPPTSSAAPPSSISTAAGAALVSVHVSQSATESTPANTSSTSAVKEAVTCTIKTIVTVSTPSELHVDPSTVSKAPPTSSSPPGSPPSTSVPSSSIAPPTTASSSSEEPPQTPPIDTPTSISSSSVAPPTTISSSSSEAPPKTTPTPAPTPSVAPPITSSPSFKVPSLTNVPSLTARSTLSHVVSATRAQAATSKKPPSTTVHSTGIVGAKLPSFDAPGDMSSIPIVTIPAALKSVALPPEAMVSVPSTDAMAATQTVTASSSVTAKLPSFSSILSAPGSVVAKTAIVSGSGSSYKSSASDTEVSTATASSSTSSLVSVTGNAVSSAAPSVTALPTAATKPSSTVELPSPSPSITTTAHLKISQQQQLPSSSAAKPHSNTISVITQLPASFIASKTASFASPVAVSSSIAAAIGGSGHHGIVLGAGSLQQREQSNIIVGMQGAERLKVGEAEILQVSIA